MVRTAYSNGHIPGLVHGSYSLFYGPYSGFKAWFVQLVLRAIFRVQGMVRTAYSKGHIPGLRYGSYSLFKRSNVSLSSLQPILT